MAKGVRYSVLKRAVAIVSPFSPVTGATGKAADLVNVVDVSVGLGNQGMRGFVWFASPSTGGNINIGLQWFVDAAITGG
jgi:hypothetical protein